MSDPLDDMMKATRLTQAGRLDEATALLQRMLGVATPHVRRRQKVVRPSQASSLRPLTAWRSDRRI